MLNRYSGDDLGKNMKDLIISSGVKNIKRKM